MVEQGGESGGEWTWAKRWMDGLKQALWRRYVSVEVERDRAMDLHVGRMDEF